MLLIAPMKQGIPRLKLKQGILTHGSNNQFVESNGISFLPKIAPSFLKDRPRVCLAM
jgi:hypothetical protein